MINLDIVAARLEGLEETIIAKLLDRVQFRRNPAAYIDGKSGFEGSGTSSLFSLRLLYQEQMDALFGRFCVPEERPFCNDLPAPKRIVTLPPDDLHLEDYACISQTQSLKSDYLDLLDNICPAGDDGQYGSSVEHDIQCLQAISRRVHYGALYVAESKYQANPELYAQLIIKKNRDEVIKQLTRIEVEEKILLRVLNKVNQLQAAANPKIRTVIKPELIADFYRHSIIPLTKEGEWLYLLNRAK